MGDPWFERSRTKGLFNRRRAIWPVRWQGCALILAIFGVLAATLALMPEHRALAFGVFFGLGIPLSIVTMLNTDQTPPPPRRKGDLRDG